MDTFAEGDPCLYIRFYNDFEWEASKQELADIHRKFGGLPSASLIADVSGRHYGYDEVIAFVSLLLENYEGFAQDDYSDHFWALDEVLTGPLKLEDGSELEFFRFPQRLP